MRLFIHGPKLKHPLSRKPCSIVPGVYIKHLCSIPNLITYQHRSNCCYLNSKRTNVKKFSDIYDLCFSTLEPDLLFMWIERTFTSQKNSSRMSPNVGPTWLFRCANTPHQHKFGPHLHGCYKKHVKLHSSHHFRKQPWECFRSWRC